MRISRIGIRRGFLIEVDADADEFVEGVALADDCGSAVVGVEIEEVK